MSFIIFYVIVDCWENALVSKLVVIFINVKYVF